MHTVLAQNYRASSHFCVFGFFFSAFFFPKKKKSARNEGNETWGSNVAQVRQVRRQRDTQTMAAWTLVGLNCQLDYVSASLYYQASMPHNYLRIRDRYSRLKVDWRDTRHVEETCYEEKKR